MQQKELNSEALAGLIQEAKASSAAPTQGERIESERGAESVSKFDEAKTLEAAAHEFTRSFRSKNL